MKEKNSNRFVSSDKWYVQIFGALLLDGYRSLFLILIGIATWILGAVFENMWFLVIVAITLILWAVWHVVRRLNPIFSLRKKELKITISQIVLLCVIGLWICVVGLTIANNVKTNMAIPISVISSVLAWIFQDTIKSVASFFYLRMNGLLHIGDWIEMPSKGVDGMVKNVTLTTVTIDNWDTTTSAIPTYLLNSDHFRNNQQMMEGRTYGRMMRKSFIIDTGWIHTMTEEELSVLKEKLNGMEDIDRDFYEYYINNGEAKAGRLNAQLYRNYIYHWLMHNENVSHEPRLIVRWLEQTPEGLPLQVYIFITSTSLAPFEWQQSLIIERIVESLAWFNLQLYQSPSGYDASNGNIYMSDKPANYLKKNQSNDR